MNHEPRWTGLLLLCAALKTGDSFILDISEGLVESFRAILRVSGRTSRWRWSVVKLSPVKVKKSGIEIRPGVLKVKKVGLW